MNQSKLFYLCIILINIVFYECKTSNKSQSIESPNSDINILAYYGNQIYIRESCSSCHTQLIEEETEELISLDGIGNQYPNSWYYYYFYDPTYTIADSKKSSYSHLHSEPLDKLILRKIISEKGLKTNEDTLWNELNYRADIISSKLNKEGLTAYNSSVVALISYLQQIPSSNKKKELDSLVEVEKMKREKVWDEILQDSSKLATIIEDNNGFLDEGKSLFNTNCSACHGEQGGGLIGPNLTDDYWLHGGEKIDVAKTIVNGIPNKGMISWSSRLSPPEVGKLVAYLISIRGTNPANSMPPRGIKE
jgi:cytochrome c oxidase cbb3-type subunit 3